MYFSRTIIFTAMALPSLSLTVNSLADTHRAVLPVGTVLRLSLDRPLSSASCQPGDKFVAVVKTGKDDAGLPTGTRVEGVVREALPMAKGKPGVLDLDFRTVVFPNGAGRTPIEGSLYSLDGKELKRQDGRLVATADKRKDRMKWVGIGAGAGLVLGTITKGNKVVDTLLGAGAGYLYNELQGKKPKDVKLETGAEFGIRLERSLAFKMDDYAYQRVRTGYYDDETSGDHYKLLANDNQTKPNNKDDRYYKPTNVATDRPSNSGDNNASDIGLLVNDREVRFGSAKPFSRNDIILIPIETVAKSEGFDYRYEPTEKAIYSLGGKLRLAIGSKVALINGERKLLPSAAEIKNGVIYVPMQFVGWATKGSASYDPGSKTVIITTERN